MKTIDASLLSSSSLCYCLRVDRVDGVIMRFTSADCDVPVATGNAVYDGLYEARTGLDVSNLVVQAGLAVDNMELPVLPDETTYPQVDILAGRWDNAKFRLFETDYLAPTQVNLLKRGTAGDAETVRGSRKFEFRGLKQALQQPIGRVTSKTCCARVFDFPVPPSPYVLCRLPITGWQHNYAVTSVASRHIFTCVGAGEASDYYGDGIAIGLAGPNAGYGRKIKSFAVGVFTLALEFPFAVSVGDTFTFIAGCRKRLMEDCKAKFNNVLNFQGEPDVPGNDLLTADPEVAS